MEAIPPPDPILDPGPQLKGAAGPGPLDVFAVVVRVPGERVTSSPAAPEELTFTCMPADARVLCTNSKVKPGPGGGTKLSLKKDRAGCYVCTSTMRLWPGALSFEVSDEGDAILEGRVASRGGAHERPCCWELECRAPDAMAASSKGEGRPSLLLSAEVEVCFICRHKGESICLSESYVPESVSASQATRGGLQGIPEEASSDEHPGLTALRSLFSGGGGGEPGGGSGLLEFDPLVIPQRFEETYRAFGGQGSLSSRDGNEQEQEMTWFNAGLRVGLGVGLGMCIGMGLGVGLAIRGYNSATSRIRNRLL